MLSRYHLAYPDVRLDLVTGTSGALIAKVLRDELQPAFRERLVLIAPKSLRRVRCASDLAQRTVIAFGAGCSYRRCLEDWLAQSKLAPLRILEFTSYHAIVTCVAAGSGVALVPESVITTVPAGKHVSIHRIAATISRPRTMLVWREGHRSNALDALRSELVRNSRSRKRGSGASPKR